MPAKLFSEAAQTALVLAGGNALGAYQAGAYEALHEAGVRPSRIGGCSIGAVNAALIAGNPVEDRVAALRRFWERVSGPAPGVAAPTIHAFRLAYNGLNALGTRLFGRPHLFRPRIEGLLHALNGTPQEISLYEAGPLRETLSELVDLERLNAGEPWLAVAATDVASGEAVHFDNRRHRLTLEHVLASTALPPDFPAVAVEDRICWDGALTGNLPLEPALAGVTEDTVCFAVDLFDQQATLPESLDGVLQRRDELIFAGQSARALEALRREHRFREVLGERKVDDLPAWPANLLIAHIAYRGKPDDGTWKLYDYSPATLHERWAKGFADMQGCLAGMPREVSGFSLYRPRRPLLPDRRRS